MCQYILLFFSVVSHTGLFAYAFAVFIILNSYLAELNLRGMNQEELPQKIFSAGTQRVAHYSETVWLTWI